MAHILNHPCEGKDCRECTVCKFDEPIPTYEPPKKDEKPVTIDGVCNYCGYLIKNYSGHGDTKFNACCGKCIIESPGFTRPRTISFGVDDTEDVQTPGWCPNILNSRKSRMPQAISHVTHQPLDKSIYEIYQEKRKKYESLPKHIEWENLKEGKIYVIPTIIKQRGKVVLAVAKTEYTLRCVALDENFKETPYYHNVYRQDLDARFIVEYHKY